MNDYKELIADLTAAANRNSNSLNTRDTCRKAADAIEQLVRERDAAIADISYLIIRPLEVCKLCAHDFADTAAEKCPNCSDITAYGNFEWRGVSK